MAGLRMDDRGIVVRCPSCGTANRQMFAVLGQTTRCGKCHTALPPPDQPVEVPGSLDFWAEWCGPCRMVAPHLVTVAGRNAGRLVVAKVDTESVPDLSARLGIRSIPTLAVYDGGTQVARTAGAMAADQIEQFVRTATAGE